MCIDIGVMALSVRDIEKSRVGLKDLERRIDEEKSWTAYCNSINYTTTCMRTRAPTTLERAIILLDEHRKKEAKPPDERQSHKVVHWPNVEGTQWGLDLSWLPFKQVYSGSGMVPDQSDQHQTHEYASMPAPDPDPPNSH
ncbi:hypothetical protein ON010_g558 [Phytophthora cinnamomi]|nr:hypothetical protein ON010_g558 [Phytophthora cinnamomi]